MDYYDGITLMEYIQRMGGKIEWQMAIKIMTPIMDALREVHSKGFLHRDIKPQNIYLTKENRIILLDFGSARQAMGERSKSLSMIFTPGFAAFEQYHRRGNQGPWTDVYGVAATIYFMITGDAPPEANGRIERDSIQLPSQMMIAVPQNVEKGLIKGLAVKVGERFESVQLFQNNFLSVFSNNINKTPHVSQQSNVQQKVATTKRFNAKNKTNQNSSEDMIVLCNVCGQINPVREEAPMLICLRCCNPLTSAAINASKLQAYTESDDGSFSGGGCLKGCLFIFLPVVCVLIFFIIVVSLFS